MTSIYVFPAAHEVARLNRELTIEHEIPLDKATKVVSPTAAQIVRAAHAEAGGLWAWDARDGVCNRRSWKTMEPGDFVLCEYGSTFHYAMRVISTLESLILAKVLWKPDDEGKQFPLIYFVTRPFEVNVPTANFEGKLSRIRFPGFCRVTITNIREYGSVEAFFGKEFAYR